MRAAADATGVTPGSGARAAAQRAYFALERWITPETRYSQAWYEERLGAAVTLSTRWLDVGCGHQVLPSWREAEERQLLGRAGSITGLDPDEHALRMHRSIRCRVAGDIAQLPFPDGRFDLVTANMVVEHLDRPEIQFQEVLRVLAPGGRFLFHTPNARAYTTVLARYIPDGIKAQLVRFLDGRTAEDVYPAYYRANTDSRIRRLSEVAGFEIEAIDPITTGAVLAAVPPLAMFELLWIRLLEKPAFTRWRQTLIVTLRRPTGGAASREQLPPATDTA